MRNYKPILARGSHIGQMICVAAEQKGIDFLVIGRRGMNRFSRLVVGSTSKHVMENAPFPGKRSRRSRSAKGSDASGTHHHTHRHTRTTQRPHACTHV